MYKTEKHQYLGQPYHQITRINADGSTTSIPDDPANTDYAQFKLDIAEGVTLLDAEGVEMTPEQVQAFLETLP